MSQTISTSESADVVPFEVSNDLRNSGDALRGRMNAQGYLFFRALIPLEPILAARREPVCEKIISPTPPE